MKKNPEDYILELLRLLESKSVRTASWKTWMEGFLRDLAGTGGNVSRACELAGISRNTAYRNKRRNPEFARRWEDVVQDPRRHR